MESLGRRGLQTFWTADTAGCSLLALVLSICIRALSKLLPTLAFPSRYFLAGKYSTGRSLCFTAALNAGTSDDMICLQAASC
jgi:hypothetical protein